MKQVIIAAFILLCCPHFLFSQTTAQPSEKTIAPEVFSDSMKVFWDELKKDADSYAAIKQSKGEFETTAEFQARLEKDRSDTQKKMENFLAAGHYAERTYSVWMKAALLHYNADAQLYTLGITGAITIPPAQQNITTACPPNPYFTITDSTIRGYKFSYFALKDKQEFLWHVDETTARTAKSSEQNIYFRVWLHFDFSQVFTKDEAQIMIVPTKFELVNKADNLILWSDSALQ